MEVGGHWASWHAAYEDPDSSLSRRLVVVQHRLRQALDDSPAGPIRLISMCAGQCRDVIGVLPDHLRKNDVTARLVELDAGLAGDARAMAKEAGLLEVEIVEGDAALTSAYVGAVPANIVLACGIFGNVSSDDIRGTIEALPTLCAPGATVIWTRHHLPPDMTPTIRSWFADSGFEEIAFDTEQGRSFSVGTHRLVGHPRPFRENRRMFTFSGDGSGART